MSSEELIKYAHKISASNAVAAPATWGPGQLNHLALCESIDEHVSNLQKLVCCVVLGFYEPGYSCFVQGTPGDLIQRISTCEVVC